MRFGGHFWSKKAPFQKVLNFNNIQTRRYFLPKRGPFFQKKSAVFSKKEASFLKGRVHNAFQVMFSCTTKSLQMRFEKTVRFFSHVWLEHRLNTEVFLAFLVNSECFFVTSQHEVHEHCPQTLLSLPLFHTG